ncbi:integrator complex subunit 2 [Macrosteles quadrilineatus]|uniref:integrator complex subunit 2 n=1 Tax=Macrosteles quadrilineatus TaxID=74068 RepID=UPI0023E2FAB6|nr:integrator complex subunit 2 [Macrosteles quadrilineatus]
MAFNYTVSPKVFKALQTVDIEQLSKCTAKEIRPILPCLVRMSLISPMDSTKKCTDGRKQILTILSGIELVNTIVALLSIDFHGLELDVKKEQMLRQKQGSAVTDSVLVQGPPGLAFDFERTDSTRRLRLVLYEILMLQSQKVTGESFVKQSDLFDCSVYIPEICDVINIALAELPALLSVQDMAETLLRVKHGPEIICWMVANSPDTFNEVTTSLITNADPRDEDNGGSRVRTQALNMLCQMNPSQALAVRAKCVEMCRLPALAVNLTLDHGSSRGGDVVAFVSGLLLGNDQHIRNWFASFVRSRQKQRHRENSATMQALRDELIHQLQDITLFSPNNKLPESRVVQASALLRLYCALRGIAGTKFQEEEISLIVQLVTSHPPPTPAGVRFVSLGLCMLIACPSLIAQHEHETKCIEWVRWLVREEAYFESASGVTASFGEMLLLMAIHFHSNQLSAIFELVSSTLGMKVPIRHNNMTRMKQIFTQEIFTEQVVTSHAVKVPVTVNLNANIQGFLPVHCIHQLLKSRAFTKHKVPIKDWIYRQICSSEPPLHPVLPALVEVYVNSILVSTSKTPQTPENTNQPITTEEIRRVFRDTLTQKELNVDCKCASLTAQLLLLYYLLHYEDVRMGQWMAIGREKVKSYSAEFLSELPIKYLLQQAQRNQQSFAGLFSPLLRLLATHFPHLSLVDDWIEEDEILSSQEKTVPISSTAIVEGLSAMSTCPSHTGKLLKQLLEVSATQLWPHVDVIIKHFRNTLEPNVPRYIQELYRQVWLKLNTVLPRCLWVKTISAFMHEKSILPSLAVTQENAVLDPLQVLRWDTRAFRCAGVLKVLLRVLQASLAASRNQLARHQLETPAVECRVTEPEREELRSALVAAQDSCVLQILLEACLESPEDRETPGQLWALREVRSIICSYLHQVFISEPSLAKLVHFQGYPRELLPVTVKGIPSMHICLDFIPELLSQPSLEKQVFAVDLVSHLSLHYALPKSMSVARLAINTLSTLVTVLSSENRTELFTPALPALVRVCEAFPPLVDDVVSLLLQVGRVCLSEACAHGSYHPASLTPYDDHLLVGAIQQAFIQILTHAVLKVKVY